MEAVVSLIATGERKPDQCWDLSKSPLGFSTLMCMLSLHKGCRWKLPCLSVKWPGDLQRSALSNPSVAVKLGLHPSTTAHPHQLVSHSCLLSHNHRLLEQPFHLSWGKEWLFGFLAACSGKKGSCVWRKVLIVTCVCTENFESAMQTGTSNINYMSNMVLSLKSVRERWPLPCWMLALLTGLT